MPVWTLLIRLILFQVDWCYSLNKVSQHHNFSSPWIKFILKTQFCFKQNVLRYCVIPKQTNFYPFISYYTSKPNQKWFENSISYLANTLNSTSSASVMSLFSSSFVTWLLRLDKVLPTSSFSWQKHKYNIQTVILFREYGFFALQPILT